MFLSSLPVLVIFIAALFIFLIAVAFILVLAFFLPYFVWVGIQNAKGRHLELSENISPDKEIRNAFKWWKSIFTHKPAF